MASNNREIADRKRAEKSLRDSEKRFRDLAELLPQTIYEMDFDGRFTFVNRQALEMFGYTQAEYEGGVNCFDMLAREDIERASRNVQTILRGENLPETEYTAQRKDGTQFPVVIYASAILRDDVPVGLRGIVVDITERRRAEEALRESEERFRLTFDQLPIGAAIVSLDFRFVRVNDVLCRMTGYSSEELGHLCFLDLTHPDDLVASVERAQRLIADKVDHYEMDTRCLRKDGGVTWIHLVVRTMKSASGKPLYFLPTMEDITERKLAEEAMRRSAKIQAEAETLAVTGRMAAMIAHEINNPLAGIKNSFRLIRDAVSTDHPDRDMVWRIEREIDRIAQIVRKMCEIYSPRMQESSDISVAETFHEVLTLVEILRRECEVAVELATVSPGLTVRAYPGGLQRVLYHLLTNAIHASPRGAVVGVAAELADEDHVRISIHDRGGGIPAEVRDRIFEPFFSADTDGIPKHGLGIGLAVVKNIVDSLQGRIEFVTMLGQGTCFRVYLPSKQS